MNKIQKCPHVNFVLPKISCIYLRCESYYRGVLLTMNMLKIEVINFTENNYFEEKLITLLIRSFTHSRGI